MFNFFNFLTLQLKLMHLFPLNIIYTKVRFPMENSTSISNVNYKKYKFAYNKINSYS